MNEADNAIANLKYDISVLETDVKRANKLYYTISEENIRLIKKLVDVKSKLPKRADVNILIKYVRASETVANASDECMDGKFKDSLDTMEHYQAATDAILILLRENTST